MSWNLHNLFYLLDSDSNNDRYTSMDFFIIPIYLAFKKEYKNRILVDEAEHVVPTSNKRLIRIHRGNNGQWHRRYWKNSTVENYIIGFFR